MTTADFRTWDLLGDGPPAVLRGPEPLGPLDITLADLVVAGSERDLEATAVDCSPARLSYRALLDRAYATAGWLQAQGTRAEEPIAVLADRTSLVYPAILACLLSGCAYVPLDPAMPPAWLRAALSRCGCRFVVTTAVAWAELGMPGERALLVDDPLPFQAGMVRSGRIAPIGVLPPAGRAGAHPGPNGLAYVAFTSGSAGEPKGVLVEHRSAVNLVHWVRQVAGLTAAARVTQQAGLSFDASVQQIFATWASGATLVPVPERVRVDPAAMLRWLSERRITHWDSVPSLWAPVAARAETADLPDLRVVLLAGERLLAQDVITFRHWARGVRLLNIYGPTEATVDATWYEVPGPPVADPIPIGRPLPGITSCVLDGHGRPCPPGADGELYLGGAGLARGYLADDEDRFAVIDAGDGPVRLYRTGDLVRLVDKDLVFLGRKDDQVKINGVRIELGGVEQALRGDPGVAEAAALLVPREPGPGAELGALLVLRPGCGIDPVRARLAHSLPQAMLPRHIAVVGVLPRTPGGKPDRAACLATLRDVADADAQPGRAPTPTEAAILRLWRDVLAVPHVDLDDDFFRLGGDSISTIRLRHACADAGLDIDSADVFTHPTPRRLASLLASRRRERPVALGSAGAGPRPDTREDVPLLPAQRAVVAAGLLAADHAARQVGLVQEVYTFTEELDEQALRSALQTLVARHDALRVAILLSERGSPVQRIAPDASIPLAVHDFAALSEPRQRDDVARLARERLAAGIPLDVAPLLRCDVAARGPSRFSVIWTAHHAITDGWSWNILQADFADAYQLAKAGRPPPPAPSARLSYADFARRAAASPGELPAGLLAQLGALPALPLPPPPGGSSGDRSHVEHVVQRAELAAASARLGVGESTLHLHALGRAVRRLCRQPQFPVGVVCSGRDVGIPGVGGLVGCLARFVPVPVELTGQLGADLRRLDDALRSATALDGIDVDDALTRAGLPLTVRAPAISFVFQGNDTYNSGAPLRIDTADSFWSETSATPLSLVVHVPEPGLAALRLEFWPDMVDAGFVAQLGIEIARSIRRLVGT